MNQDYVIRKDKLYFSGKGKTGWTSNKNFALLYSSKIEASFAAGLLQKSGHDAKPEPYNKE